ncbi:polysaccharide pyruvyl transferase family protein [Mailhella massiliensis]|uniref:polysaccharide pyruvyl transferase family protein n=1 Tax=Mailhella massiliensis TaxID=1903261 RepID=UPI002354CA16|nr:polysaccharide pyruvyl transferase family protein [Mailhella massiliensis]
MGKILLLGGTGALGAYLVDELVKTDHSVYITSRSKHNDYNNIHYLLGNAKDEVFLESVLKDSYDCVVDFMIWPTLTFKNKYEEIINKTGHYIYLSSYRAYADSDMKPLSEESPLLVDVTTDKEYLKTDEYALAKGREERVLKDSPYSNYTIIRPAITFSKSRFQLGTLEASSIIHRTIKGLPLLLPREMMNKRAAVSWAGDVGRMMAFLLGNDKAKKEIFNVATAESHTWGEIATYYHELIGTNIVLGDLNSYINVVRGQYQVKYDRMLNRVVDNSKILNLMKISNSDLMPVRSALAKELADLPAVAKRIKEDVQLCKRMDDQIQKLPKPLEFYFSDANNEKGQLKTTDVKEDKSNISRIKNNEKDKNIKNVSITQKNINKYVNKCKVGILNFHFANNYGAVLVPFAMKKAIEAMGYEVEIINYIAQKFSRQPAFVKFRGKYLSPISREFTSKEELEEYADHWSRIVVGSDQVWRMFQTDIYMLGWASGKCSFISYAASYGHDIYEGSILKSDACALLHRFDAISVREKSGVDICHNDFDVNAVQVLDPTFLLSAEAYSRVIDAEKTRVPDEPYVCGVFLSAQSASYPNNPNILLDIRSKYKFVNPIKDERNQFRPVGEWLALIKNAKYVITDSFHGAVFSIIFNKQFISIMHEGFNGNARIPSLLSSLGISHDRIVYSIDDITVESFYKKIDYSKVNPNLQALRHKSWRFLKEALSKDPEIKDPVVPIDSYEAMKCLEIIKDNENFSAKQRFYKKWVELRLAENSEIPAKVEELERRVSEIEVKRNYSFITFCIYWMYRGLFRISSGNLKAKFKQKRAYYRKIVKGK